MLFFQSLVIFFLFCRVRSEVRIENVKYRRHEMPSRAPRSTNQRIKKVNEAARNVTMILNNILSSYNPHLRPSFDQKTPLKVYIDVFINSMGHVNDLSHTFSFNCYFRQTWTDNRLKFDDKKIGFRQLSLSMAMLEKIWKPDTYFWNGAGSYVHTMTSSNRLVRLEPDGTVLFSSRITVKARCEMDMTRYPLDRQACRLIIGSYAYSSSEIEYEWKIVDKNRGVKMADESIADLPQFSLTGTEVLEPANFTRDRNYSALEVRFYFHRHFGYFLMNFYVPCTLVALLCWVAFFTKREATAERIGIGITNVLTIVLISMDSKTDSPKVEVPTALDMYVWICYITHLLCMVEFTVVHYYTKYNTGDPEIQEVERERLRQIIRQIPKTSILSERRDRARPKLKKQQSFTSRRARFSSVRLATQKVERPVRKLTSSEGCKALTMNDEKLDLETIREENIGWRLYYWMLDRDIKTDPFGLAENSSSKIDRISIVAAPLIFCFTIFIYYQLYVGHPQNFHFKDNFLRKF